MRSVTGWVAAILVGASLTGVFTDASARSRLEREGTIGLSLYGGYGTILGDSRYGYDFEDGGNYGITLRYTLGTRTAIGLRFQNQQYAAKDGLTTGDEENPVRVDEFVSTEVMGDFYLFADRSKDTSPYLVFGIGFYRPEIHVQDDFTLFPTENFLFSAGVGAEIFIRETFGIDLSGRAVGYVGQGYTDQEEPDPQAGSFALGLAVHVGIFFYILR